MRKAKKVSLTKVLLSPNEIEVLTSLLYATQHDDLWHEDIQETARKLLEKIAIR